MLDEIQGVNRVALLHNDLVFWHRQGPHKDGQADQLVPAQVSKGLQPLQQAQQSLQLLLLQGPHLCM